MVWRVVLSRSSYLVSRRLARTATLLQRFTAMNRSLAVHVRLGGVGAGREGIDVACVNTRQYPPARRAMARPPQLPARTECARWRYPRTPRSRAGW